MIEQLINDINWEEEQKAKGIRGWKLTQLFLERILESYASQREAGEDQHESSGDKQSLRPRGGSNTESSR